MPDGSSTSHLLWPKLATTFSEGYGLGALRKDAVAALTVAIVALPLSMAIAVASGVGPERGLYTAIVGGFVVSLLSGSRFQIGGPAGAFIVLVAATQARFGTDGLLLTVLLSGATLTLVGALRLGSLIRHIPHAVTIGFTCAIAVTIAASQLKDLGGLKLAGAEPGALFPKLIALGAALPTLTPAAFAVGTGVAAIIFTVRRFRPTWPGMLIAVALAAILAGRLHLPIATIASRFGALPHGLPMPRLPAFNWALALQVLPAALSFTLLGGIESLLSAKVADGMTRRKHRSNMEHAIARQWRRVAEEARFAVQAPAISAPAILATADEATDRDSLARLIFAALGGLRVRPAPELLALLSAQAPNPPSHV